MKKTTKTNENKPEQKFKCGNVTATIWKKEIEKDNKTFDVYNVEITKNYKDGDEWKKTNNFNRDDLQKVIIVTTKAQEFLYLNECE